MLTLTTPPAAEPISIAALKARLRVTHDAEDDLITALIPAARQRVEAELGLALAVAAFRETFDGAPAEVVLARGPRVSVDAVAVADLTGAWTPLSANDWRASADDRPTRIAICTLVAPGAGALFGLSGQVGLRVDYTAGFPACPAPLVEAVLAIAAEAYDRRGDPAPTLAVAEPWLAAFRRGRL